MAKVTVTVVAVTKDSSISFIPIFYFLVNSLLLFPAAFSSLLSAEVGSVFLEVHFIPI